MRLPTHRAVATLGTSRFARLKRPTPVQDGRRNRGTTSFVAGARAGRLLRRSPGKAYSEAVRS